MKRILFGLSVLLYLGQWQLASAETTKLVVALCLAGSHFLSGLDRKERKNFFQVRSGRRNGPHAGRLCVHAGAGERQYPGALRRRDGCVSRHCDGRIRSGGNRDRDALRAITPHGGSYYSIARATKG